MLLDFYAQDKIVFCFPLCEVGRDKYLVRNLFFLIACLNVSVSRQSNRVGLVSGVIYVHIVSVLCGAFSNFSVLSASRRTSLL